MIITNHFAGYSGVFKLNSGVSSWTPENACRTKDFPCKVTTTRTFLFHPFLRRNESSKYIVWFISRMMGIGIPIIWVHLKFREYILKEVILINIIHLNLRFRRNNITHRMPQFMLHLLNMDINNTHNRFTLKLFLFNPIILLMANHNRWFQVLINLNLINNLSIKIWTNRKDISNHIIKIWANRRPINNHIKLSINRNRTHKCIKVRMLLDVWSMCFRITIKQSRSSKDSCYWKSKMLIWLRMYSELKASLPRCSSSIPKWKVYLTFGTLWQFLWMRFVWRPIQVSSFLFDSIRPSQQTPQHQHRNWGKSLTIDENRSIRINWAIQIMKRSTNCSCCWSHRRFSMPYSIQSTNFLWESERSANSSTNQRGRNSRNQNTNA